MSTQLASFIVPRPIATPRGAEWLSELAISLVPAGRMVWAALVSVEEARAQRELNRLAVRRGYEADQSKEVRVAMILGCGNRG
jgi:hypothetical protein